MKRTRFRLPVAGLLAIFMALSGLFTGVAMATPANLASSTIEATQQQTNLARAALHFRETSPVYVDPNVTNARLTNDQIEDLTKAIRDGDHPMFIAVFSPNVKRDVNNNPDLLPRELARHTGLAGVYVVWADGAFRADATQSAGVPQAGTLASTVYNKHQEGDVSAMLTDYVNRVQAIPLAANAAQQPHPFPWGWVTVAFIALIGAILLALLLVRRNQKTAADKRRLERGMDDLQTKLYGPIFTNERAVDKRTEAQTKLTQARQLLTNGHLSDASTRYKEALADYNAAEKAENQSNDTVGTPPAATSTTFHHDDDLPADAFPDDAHRAHHDRPYHSPSPRRPHQAPYRVDNYPGRDYRYHSDRGDYGYYAYDGSFVPGMLLGVALADTDDDHRETVVVPGSTSVTGDQPADDRPEGSATTTMSEDVGGGGGWGKQGTDNATADTGATTTGPSTHTPTSPDPVTGDLGGGGGWSTSSEPSHRSYTPDPAPAPAPASPDHGSTNTNTTTGHVGGGGGWGGGDSGGTGSSGGDGGGGGGGE